MSVFDRWFGKSAGGAIEARRAELEGDLPRAAHLWAEAGRADEAARVMLLRGDAEAESTRRLQFYVQAVALAPPGHAIRDIARRKRALLALEMAKGGAVTSAAGRRDLLDAGHELEALGETASAAQAFGLAGDVEGQTRALVKGGEIEQLEDVLERDRDRSRGERERLEASMDIERLLASGLRREALERAERGAREIAGPASGSGSPSSAGERALVIRAARASGVHLTIELRGERLRLVLGEDVILGRSEGAITIASHAVSRRHVRVARAGEQVEVSDLGSRNGTVLRGMRIAGALPVPPAGLDLALGGEVPLRIAPASELHGAVILDVGGARYVAPLGPARLGVGAWRIERATDGWLELVTGDGPFAYLRNTGAVPMRMGARTPLLAGDAFSEAPGSAPVFRVL
ncbi:MAG TPA: FHA domain-containing protein [Polyangiaceae bacterium]